MKKLFLFPFLLLFVTSVAAQDSFTVSEVSDIDNHNATAFQANGLSEKDIADIRALLKAHEKNALASDWVADAQLYTEDAMRFPPGGESIKGRKAIQSALESIESVSSFTHEILEVNGCSNIAYVIVKYSFTAKQVESSESSVVNGKSLNILKKQSDNTWKLFRVLWN
jgi:ketosteroid isomerase-like protein